VPRIFALKILFHSGFALSQAQTDELLDGLSGKGSFLDWSETLSDDGVAKVAASERFLSKIIERLNSEVLNDVQSAASNLIYYHYAKLTNEQKALAWLFYIHQYDSGLLDFHRNHQPVLCDPEFVNALSKVIKDKRHLIDGKKFLFELYRDVVVTGNNYDAFFEMLIVAQRGFSRDNLEHMFELFIDIGKANEESGKNLGSTISRLMALPAISQNRTDNMLLPEMAILAHEFGTLDKNGLSEIVKGYRISKDEIAASLLYRLGEIPDEYHPDRVYKGHILIFTDFDSIKLPQFKKEDTAVLLVDAEDVPDRFLQFIIWSLITKAFTKDELLQLSAMGNLAKFFVVDVNFCLEEEFNPDLLHDANDIGSLKHYLRAKTQYLKSVIYKIKEVMISDPNERPIYQAALINSIDESNASEVVDTYAELIALDYHLEPDHIAKLFDALMEVPYRLDFNLMHQIFTQIVKVAIDDKEKLVKSLNSTLKSALSTTSEYHDGKLDGIGWAISLIILFLTDELTEEAENGFLSGLRSLFIQDGPNYSGEENHKKFKARDVLVSSQII